MVVTERLVACPAPIHLTVLQRLFFASLLKDVAAIALSWFS